MADLLTPLLAIGLGAGILYFNLWRAVLCLRPDSLEVEADAPPGTVKLPHELTRADGELRALGFLPVGSRYEKAPLAREVLSYDYAHPGDKAFATLHLGRDGKPRLYFLSQTDRSAFVISADYRRPAREIPGRYFSASLESFAPDRVYKAHLRRVASFGNPVGQFDQQGRLAAARAWFAGPGRSEIRLQNVHGLLWSVFSLGMVGAALLSR